MLPRPMPELSIDMGSECQDGDVLGALVLLEQLGRPPAVHHRHREIHQDQIRAVTRRVMHPVLSVDRLQQAEGSLPVSKR